MNLSLKHKLMLQSLSPLAFLTIVRNFKFTPVSELAENQSYWGEFVRLNNVLIVVFLLCATWILAAIISFISFTAFRWTDKKQGYQLSSFVEKEDASLNFFMTMIIPLLIDDVGTIQGAVTFLIIVVMMCALLSKTHFCQFDPDLKRLHFLSFSFFLSHYKQERKVKGCRNKHFVDLQQLQASLEKQWGVF